MTRILVQCEIIYIYLSGNGLNDTIVRKDRQRAGVIFILIIISNDALNGRSFRFLFLSIRGKAVAWYCYSG